MYDLPGQSLSVSLINPSQMRTDFSHVPLSSLKTAMISAKKKQRLTPNLRFCVFIFTITRSRLFLEFSPRLWKTVPFNFPKSFVAKQALRGIDLRLSL